ncbi:BT4734/BF3469 family protein [Bergeyella zoohelcum]|uniref:BT4734/BF3469 family protein n=1 Tax=Bergeyella zoohelcum TaxID=1015 RepID=UPI002A91E314|nr:BT4734/BF3469 family protein [Bergeyella zoohelcum]MDY6026460.1 BT4734/BF3469 family protein [Bergeyella zoohelcum]
MNTTINLCQSITSRNIIYSVRNLEEYINLIKDEKPQNALIMKLRSLDRANPEFDKIKKHQLPCAVLHFNYDRYIRQDKTLSSTGYLYFDIDETIDEEILKSNPYIAAYWKSVSGRGYGLAVNVLGITLENYNSAFPKIAEILKLPIDPQAKSKDRLTVLSYDPNAYYNPEALIIKVEDLDLSSENSPIFRDIVKKNSPVVYNVTENSKIRYDNLEDIIKNMNFNFVDGVCDLKDNKIPYTSAFIPKNVKKGNREKTLGLFCENFLALNPHIAKEHFERMIKSFNIKNLEEPLGARELKSIIDKKWSKRYYLKPFHNNQRRFIFENTNLPLVDKRRKIMDAVNEDRKEKTKKKQERIKDILENWNCQEDEKVTAKKIILKDPELKKTMVYDFLKKNPDLIPNCE